MPYPIWVMGGAREGERKFESHNLAPPPHGLWVEKIGHGREG